MHRPAALAVALASLPAWAGPPAAAPPADDCSDDGLFSGAAIGRHAVRYCADRCWSFDLDTGRLTPIDGRSVAARGDELAVAPFKVGDFMPPASEWFTPADGLDTVTVCDPQHACNDFAIPHDHPSPEDELNSVGAAEVSVTGNRVAVLRGMEAGGDNLLELYDRATGKRLAVARPKAACIHLLGFAGEAAVGVDWDCTNRQGALIVITGAGKVVRLDASPHAFSDAFYPLDADHYAFHSHIFDDVEIVDVARGAIVATRKIDHDTTVAAGGGRAFVFGIAGQLAVIGATGKVVATGAPPTCRWHWEDESLGGVRVGMTGTDVVEAIGPPTTERVDPDGVSTLRFDKVTLTMRAQTVVAIAATSKAAKTASGIHIGSTEAELNAAYGAHPIAARWSDTVHVYGRDGDADGDGWMFLLAGGAVTAIKVSLH
jgi:hypothetical protein